MAKGAYIGVDGAARKITAVYVGVDGAARKVKKIYAGVDGAARESWGNALPESFNANVLFTASDRYGPITGSRTALFRASGGKYVGYCDLDVLAVGTMANPYTVTISDVPTAVFDASSSAGIAGGAPAETYTLTRDSDRTYKGGTSFSPAQSHSFTIEITLGGV